MPLVAIGGSAGSLDALLRFFTLLPGNCGLSFVVAVHLSPNNESSLAELIQRRTALRVEQARDGQSIRANHVSVIPPGRLIRVVDGRLKLIRWKQPPGLRTVINLLFKSVADRAHRPFSGIVLSGAGSDGAVGLQAIKQSGGLALVQDPPEASYAAMPRAALAAGSVDGILPVAEMPARLLAYFGRTPTASSPRLPRAASRVDDKPMTRKDELFVRQALACLRESTGRDFSYIRDSVLWRRLKRRMLMARVDKSAKYLVFLLRHDGEAEALVRDLLVSVTGFFRDPLAFAALGRYLPGLFHGKGPGDFVRVWVPGCATGEEAYSLAMLLLEHAGQLEHPPGIQVFGSDLDAVAIETARSGRYAAKIASALGKDRLRRFFHQEAGGYRVGEELRRVVLLTVHDVVKDPAFARMDIVSCRNLLIYLSPKARERLLQAMAFALNPDGLLFLGTSEGVDGISGAFEPLNFKHRIYRRSIAPLRAARPLADSHSILGALNTEQHARGNAHLLKSRSEDRSAKLFDQLQAGIDSWRRGLPESTQPPDLANEALRATNQEVQAINQELRATAEELEINRQELRCMNEELTAVNQELSVNLDDLARANNDLTNLINATSIPTLFLDRDARLMRYTPAAATVFCLVPSDVERPLADLRHKLDYPALLDDVRRVLVKAKPMETEVCDTAGLWFVARILPYRTAEAKVGGVVLTLYDITERKLAEALARESRAKLARELDDAKQLQKISSLMIEDESGDLIYEQILDAAITMMRAEFGSIQMLEAEGGELRLLAWRNFHPESARYWQTVSAKTGTSCGSALSRGQRIILPDVNAAEFMKGSENLRHYLLSGITAVQSTPLTTRQGRVVGMISTHWRQRHEPTERELILLDVLARQAADVLERRRVREALRSSEWLAGQGEAFQAAVNGAPLETSLGVLVRTARKEMGADVRCAFYLADAKRVELHHVVGMSEAYAECVDGFKIGPDSLACGLAVYTGQPVITPDVTQAPRWEPWLWLAERHQYRACWSFPIETESGNVVGTLAMYFNSPRQATPRDCEFASVLTRAAAIIISRTHQANERARAEDALRESGRRLQELPRRKGK